MKLPLHLIIAAHNRGILAISFGRASCVIEVQFDWNLFHMSVTDSCAPIPF